MSGEPEEIQISYEPDVPIETIESLKDDLSELTPSVYAREAEQVRVWNAPDWSLPAIVAIYISVRLADSFLDTLGKDLADVLKKAGRSVLRAVADLPSRWRRGSSTQLITPPSLSFTFEIGPHHRISFIFPPGLNDEGIEQALDAFPTALAVAISIERTILDQNGSSFHGGRATNNVYWAEQGQWVEMTAQVLMNFSKKSRGK